jgi:C1A family cysteine protease
MRGICLLFIVVICVNSELVHHELMNLIISRPTKESFKLWHFHNQRPYDINSEVGQQKYKIYKDNVNYINYKNSEVEGYKLGLGPFTDLSFEEFSQTHLKEVDPSTIKFDSEVQKEKEIQKSFSFDDLAEDDDDDDDKPFVKRTLVEQNQDRDKWGRKIIRSKDHRNSLFPTKNQGGCGSCWAFGTIGAIEAHLSIRYGITSGYNLSEQQLVDCDYSNYGCQGGWYNSAFDHLVRKGIRNGKEYKYIAVRRTCQESLYKPIVTISGYKFCSAYHHNKCTYKKQKDYIDVAPIAVAVHAGRSFVHYQQGQWYPDKCQRVNHAVVAIYLEYYEEEGKTSENCDKRPESKWRIRNSWGADWGENGQADLIAYPDTNMVACGLGDHGFLAENVTLVQ